MEEKAGGKSRQPEAALHIPSHSMCRETARRCEHHRLLALSTQRIQHHRLPSSPSLHERAPLGR
eukprot:3469653-Pleurochrysis_carterae.AAC.2